MKNPTTPSEIESETRGASTNSTTAYPSPLFFQKKNKK